MTLPAGLREPAFGTGLRRKLRQGRRALLAALPRKHLQPGTLAGTSLLAGTPNYNSGRLEHQQPGCRNSGERDATEIYRSSACMRATLLDAALEVRHAEGEREAHAVRSAEGLAGDGGDPAREQELAEALAVGDGLLSRSGVASLRPMSASMEAAHRRPRAVRPG